MTGGLYFSMTSPLIEQHHKPLASARGPPISPRGGGLLIAVGKTHGQQMHFKIIPALGGAE